MELKHIEVRGAREHNLRDVNVVLPRNQLIVFTGVSGSGKSSLAFDTLYAEGQRRYLESLSSYARQFIGQLPKPNVDYISGLSPSVSISQKSTSNNPRSTVGTITEIYDFLRVLLARVGTGFCPKCHVPITSQTRDQIVAKIQSLQDAPEYLLLAPLIREQKGEYRDLFESLRRQGYARARVDGQVVLLSNPPQLERQLKHTIEVVVSRISIATSTYGTISDAVNEALKLGQNTLVLIPWKESKKGEVESGSQPTRSSGKKARAAAAAQLVMSSEYACPQCSASFTPPSPQLLSFNSPQGMCPTCEGLGQQFTFAPELLVPEHKKSIKRGAIEPLGVWNDFSRWQRNQFLGVAQIIERDFGLPAGASLTTAWEELPPEVQQIWLHGLGDRHVTFTWRGGNKPIKFGGNFAGIIHQLMEQYRGTNSSIGRARFEKYMESRHCNTCDGQRLNPQARNLKLRSKSGRKKTEQWLSLPDVCDLPIEAALDFLSSLELNEIERKIATEALREITSRLQFLLDVGLDYLTLSRPAPSLSGGEAQRIRLASQIGAGLVGVLYVLDEPSIGLHPRDNDRLIGSLKALRDQGNSLIVVEHDEDTMREADLILDFGPGPGVRGGQLVAQGSLQDLANEPVSVTGQFLSGTASIPIPAERRPGNGHHLRIRGAAHNNLKDIDVSIPLGKLVCVTGVSGSGKSSLVGDILVPVLRRQLHASEDIPGKHAGIDGVEHLDKLIDIDQSPIGRTPRSNPATYVKVFDEIRHIFTELPESKRRGYAPGRFSFNVSGGRCEGCEGNGSNRLEMDFLSDLWITCPVCEGRRYNHETLQVLFKGKSISDVLEMDVQQALDIFENIPRIADKLRTLHDVGLDYIKLGQPSPTLSGGEAQRVKLAKELSRRDTGRTLYLLDEPTTGLHFHDIRLLLKVLQDLVDRGNSVLVIEHNLDIIKAADWIIDLGPEGGAGGGQLLFEGTPEDIQRCRASHTGKSLAKHLATLPVAVQAGKKSAKKPSDKQATKARKVSKAARTTVTPVLKIQGASQHNLKHVALELEHNTLNVFCGPSGSGKSSLAMDTIYAEGQRRYVESLSSYARQFVGQMPKPPVDRIEGLAPSIAIEQKSVAHNPRSTVGTVTEIYDYLRVLMARLGVPHCPDCDVPVSTQTAQEVAATIMKHPKGTRLILAAPLQWRSNQLPDELWQELRSAGLHRVRLAGKTYTLDEPPQLATNVHNDLQVVVDRVVISPENRARIAESVEQALSRGAGVMFTIEPNETLEEPLWKTIRHSQQLACHQCGQSLEALTPHSFSFNTPLGWCPSCEGLGTETGADPNLIVDMGKRLLDGGLKLFPLGARDVAFEMLTALARATGMPLEEPLERYTGSVRRALFYGTGERWYKVETGKHAGLQFQWKGLMPALEEASRLNASVRTALGPLTDVACSDCDGSRLTRGPAAARFRGLTMGDIVRLSLIELHRTIKGWELDRREQQIAGEVLSQVLARTEFLLDVGLDYLSLSRAANSLSGGESQRIRLASQLGSGLCGVMYVLDEPTIGLHPRDNHRLLAALNKLRDLGNTLIVVEHDREIIAGSDNLCDFGPGAGRHGGQLVAQGSPKKIAANKNSVTGPYLSGKAAIPVPSNRRPADGPALHLLGARAHTLRDIDVQFPLGTLTVVTGPSGSGKSTLVNDILFAALQNRSTRTGLNYRKLQGSGDVNKVIRVDQSPLGHNPSSTPATYTGVFELIRQLYAQLPMSRARGFTARQFSFNVPGGRCEKCEGFGQLRIEMHFLPDVWVQCDSCHGRRFTEDTLSIKYHEFSIHDILEMQVGKALEVLGNIPKIRRILQTLADVGLDYLALGQSAPTLSGGEAQRVKLAAELARPDTGRTIYLLDEPTTGLHFSDVAKLLNVLHRLVDLGNTVIVIEHNLDVIKSADWLIEMGPEAGWQGGQVVAVGTPEQIVEHARRERAAALASELPRQPNPIKKPRATRATKRNASKPAESLSAAVTADSGKLLRCHTGEALDHVLEQGPTVLREKFDPAAHFKAQIGDIELEQIGRDTLLPWQTDGRRWHTVDGIDRQGGAIRWDRSILTRVIDAIESHGGFNSTNWNHRSIVEVTGPVKTNGWFLHAVTAETWLLRLRFRVPRRAFSKEQLLKVVSLPTLNEVPEIESYGNHSRVSATQNGIWMDFEIQAYTLAEIDTPQFWKWLNHAMDEFLGLTTPVMKKAVDLDQVMPWKVMGEKWHMLRKGFPPGREVQWTPDVLSSVALTIDKTAAGKWKWDEESTARFFLDGAAEAWVTLHTKRPEGLIVVFTGPALSQLDDYAGELNVNVTNRGPLQQVQLCLTSVPASFEKLAQAHYRLFKAK